MRSTALATRRLVTSGTSRSGVIAAYIARRPNTPLEESAWIEHIEPSLPCDMARSIGQDLGAADLADDHPLGVHAQRGADEVGEGERADAFGVGLAGLERLVVGVEVLEAFEADLEGVLDRDEPLVGRDLVDEAAQGRGLPGAGAAGDDQVRSGPHRRGEEAGEQVVAHAAGRRAGRAG